MKTVVLQSSWLTRPFLPSSRSWIVKSTLRCLSQNIVWFRATLAAWASSFFSNSTYAFLLSFQTPKSPLIIFARSGLLESWVVAIDLNHTFQTFPCTLNSFLIYFKVASKGILPTNKVRCFLSFNQKAVRFSSISTTSLVSGCQTIGLTCLTIFLF